MKKIRKCVIPAAGFGTRFLPATKALPKEMFPIIDKPVMQLLVEEAVGAGCSDIIIVTGRSKRAIEDHFDSNFELEERLDKSGKFDYLRKVKGLNQMANIVYVRQPYPKGDGDAILRTKNLIGDEPFLVLFGDDIIDGEKNAAEQLIENYEKVESPVIATIDVKESEISSYGIIESNKYDTDLIKSSKILEKPKIGETKSTRAAIGKYLLSPDIFEHLENLGGDSRDGEIRLSDALESYRKQKEVYGLNISGNRFDAGDKVGYIKAVLHYGLKRDDMSSELKKYIKSLDI